MPSKPTLCLFALLGLGVMPASAAPPAVITINGKNIFPESVTSTADGTMIVGSMMTSDIYRARPGATMAQPWIHLTDGGSWGVLADPATKTLWACVVEYPVGTLPQPPAMDQRHSSLRAFDLETGAQKARYVLPGAHNACNDMAIAADRTIYISDPPNNRLLRLEPGDAAPQEWASGIDSPDGITFLNGQLYVTSLNNSHIYRVPIGANGAAGTPVDIALSQPLSGPDGMRAWNGRLYVAENRGNRVSILDVQGDSATVTVLKTGYNTSTGVSPVGGTLWVEESKQNYWRDPAMAGKDPNPFTITTLPIPQ